ncbi:hypothetical protein TNCT_372901 [Trichonephila clavata]|uniref:Uncharacterized protein n=1 Tax=Trichonephila clavata TaxID=2740835 RepID=A0A8X6H8T6_TRICU|nr:hypothetical protein TNCT_372901 [Trichonephila clavata]
MSVSNLSNITDTPRTSKIAVECLAIKNLLQEKIVSCTRRFISYHKKKSKRNGLRDRLVNRSIHPSWGPTFASKNNLKTGDASTRKGPDCLSEDHKETIQPCTLIHNLSVESPLRTSTLADNWLGLLSICSMVKLLSCSEVNPGADELFPLRNL